MKKVISISIITCLLFFSCETSKQENIISDTSQVELSNTESLENNDSQTQPENQEEQSDDAEEIQSPDSEEITESAPESESQSEDESENISAEDISQKEISEELISSEEIENDLAEKKQEQQNTKENSPIKLLETKNNPEIPKTQISGTKNPEQKIQDNKIQKTENSETADIKPETSDEIPQSKTLQQELSEASDQIKEEAVPVPSRSMQIKNHQFIDVAYPGTGWIYLGEVEKQNLFVFFGRKIENGETVFTLQPKRSGDATLHFYKNDPLSQKYIDDFMTVSVSSESATDTIHEKAPRYASIVPPKPEKKVQPSDAAAGQNDVSKNSTETDKITQTETSEISKSDTQKEDPQNIQTRISKDNSSVETVPDFTSNQKNEVQSEKSVSEQTNRSSSDLLTAAQKAYDEKKYSEALSLVRDFFLGASSRIDEGLFLEAQILEAKSPVQNIKDSIADYDTIVNKWPASKFWKKANERSIYLKRFYIDIR